MRDDGISVGEGKPLRREVLLAIIPMRNKCGSKSQVLVLSYFSNAKYLVLPYKVHV